MPKEMDTSDFASRGTAPFPPTFEDSKRISDISQWPVRMVRSKRRVYESFLERDDPMPRAKKFARHILTHLEFEDEFNKGEASFNVWVASKVLEHDLHEEAPLVIEFKDCPTGEIDVALLKRMLDE